MALTMSAVDWERTMKDLRAVIRYCVAQGQTELVGCLHSVNKELKAQQVQREDIAQLCIERGARIRALNLENAELRDDEALHIAGATIKVLEMQIADLKTTIEQHECVSYTV